MMEVGKARLHALYERLYISAQDLGAATQYAQFLLKKGWHSAPYERRGSIYMQQAAHTTALVVSYSRPFTQGKGWPPFPMALAPFDSQQKLLHEHIIGLRHQVYAHSDSSQHSVEPIQIDKFQTDIVGTPFLRLSVVECTAVIQMVALVQGRLGPELARLRRELQGSQEPNHSVKRPI